MHKFPSRYFLLAVSIAALFGCAANEEHTPRAQALTASQLQLSGEPAQWPASNWWADFADPQLTRLIELAQAGNPSLHVAESRVNEAQQFARATRAVNQPSLSLDGDFNRQRFSENDIYPPPLGGSIQNHSSLLLNFSYEFDFWGKQRATLEAALSEVDAARAEQSATRLLLSIAVAQTYYSLQHAYVEQTLATQLAQQRDALVELTRARVQRGLSSGMELDSATAASANARTDVAAARQRIDIETHQLAALCGVAPEQLPPIERRDSDRDTAALPRALPADLLGRRADIVAQSLLVRSEARQIDAAKADFYPNIDLSAFFGMESVGTNQLFKSSSLTWAAGPAVHLPLFNRDVLRAQLGSRYASYDIAVEQYNESVLAAVRETADAGSALQSAAAQRASIDAASAALQRARDAAQLRYQRGLGNRAELINADLALLAQQRALNSVRDSQMQAQLALIKALGGGYDAAATAQN